MPEKIAKANIEHFKKLLETKTDAKKRAMIERLLAEEELKLAALKKRRSERKRTDGLIPLAPVRWVHIHRRMLCSRSPSREARGGMERQRVLLSIGVNHRLPDRGQTVRTLSLPFHVKMIRLFFAHCIDFHQ
jgi:hypothetical protein